MGLGHRMPWPLQRLDGDMARPEQAQPRADRRASTAQPDMRTRIMSKQRKQLPEVSIFANNPFLEELLALRDSPEDEQLIEVSDTLWDLLEDVQLDARQRKFIWPDAERLDLEKSVQRIQKQYSHFPRDQIEEFLIDWIDMGYAPEHYSQAQLDELDRLTERWVADHLRRAKLDFGQFSTGSSAAWDAEHRIILHDLMSAFEHELHAAEVSEGCPAPLDV